LLYASSIYNFFALSSESKLTKSFDFFIYYLVKILLLILIIGFIVGVIREIITPARTKKLLSRHKAGVGNILASIIAVVTPVESFSVVPIFIGFLEAGIPTGAAFTYLITAPVTNELAFAIFWGLFGYKIAFMYYTAGIIVGLVGGVSISLLNLEKYIQPYVYKESELIEHNHHKSFKDLVRGGFNNSISFVKNFWLYIAVGIAIAALIQSFVPSDLIVKYIGFYNPYAVIVVVGIVIFMYANIAMALPVMMILIHNNLPVGTIIAFTMAVTATSIPELLILKKALKPKLLTAYISILLTLIIFTGYFLNFMF
jgi:uncharacterized protein